MNNFVNLIEYKLENSGPSAFEFVQKEIQLLFDLIEEANCIEETDLIFKNLDDIHHTLAKYVFTNELAVDRSLGEFIYDFDRVDDINTKIYIYNKIKSKTYFKQ